MPCPRCIPRIPGSFHVDSTWIRRTENPEGYRKHAVVTPLDSQAEQWVCDDRACVVAANELFPAFRESIDLLGHKGLESLADVEEVAENVVDRLDEQIADRNVYEESGNIEAAILLDSISPYLGTQHWAAVLLRDRVLCHWFDACTAADSQDIESVLKSVRTHGLCVQDEFELSKELFHEFCMLHMWYDSVGARATWGLASEAARVARMIGVPETMRSEVVSVLQQHASRGECEYGPQHGAVLSLQTDIAALEAQA